MEASASYGTFDDVRLKATGSLVLDQGRAALRLSGFRSKADGLITNTVDGRKLNDNDSWGVRGKFLFEPSDATSIYVRSEEHTSELHSLMPISYAVFCSKKTTRRASVP